jgi:hypothetical protein
VSLALAYKVQKRMYLGLEVQQPLFLSNNGTTDASASGFLPKERRANLLWGMYF